MKVTKSGYKFHKNLFLSFVSDMNKSISTFRGKVVELQATNQELVFNNKRLESTLEGNQYVLKNETG